MRHVSGSAKLPEGLRRCISGFTRLRDRKKRRISDSAELPEGLRGCVSGFTRLWDREKRSIMNYPHWKDSDLKGRRMIAQGEALGSGSKTKSPAGNPRRGERFFAPTIFRKAFSAILFCATINPNRRGRGSTFVRQLHGSYGENKGSMVHGRADLHAYRAGESLQPTVRGVSEAKAGNGRATQSIHRRDAGYGTPMEGY